MILVLSLGFRVWGLVSGGLGLRVYLGTKSKYKKMAQTLLKPCLKHPSFYIFAYLWGSHYSPYVCGLPIFYIFVLVQL